MKVRFVYTAPKQSAYPFQWDLEVNGKLTGAYILYSPTRFSYCIRWGSIECCTYKNLSEAKYACINMGLTNKRFTAI